MGLTGIAAAEEARAWWTSRLARGREPVEDPLELVGAVEQGPAFGELAVSQTAHVDDLHATLLAGDVEGGRAEADDVAGECRGVVVLDRLPAELHHRLELLQDRLAAFHHRRNALHAGDRVEDHIVGQRQVDAAWFEARAQAAADLVEHADRDAARRALEEAAELWRGRPFGELADRPLLVGDTVRLEEQWLAVREQLLQLRLDAGEHPVVVGTLQELVVELPLRERAWALLMQALYAAGRPADALATYRRLRERLAEELGTVAQGCSSCTRRCCAESCRRSPPRGVAPRHPEAAAGPPRRGRAAATCPWWSASRSSVPCGRRGRPRARADGR